MAQPQPVIKPADIASAAQMDKEWSRFRFIIKANITRGQRPSCAPYIAKTKSAMEKPAIDNNWTSIVDTIAAKTSMHLEIRNSVFDSILSVRERFLKCEKMSS